jgi:hypothetical protein
MAEPAALVIASMAILRFAQDDMRVWGRTMKRRNGV